MIVAARRKERQNGKHVNHNLLNNVTSLQDLNPMGLCSIETDKHADQNLLRKSPWPDTKEITRMQPRRFIKGNKAMSSVKMCGLMNHVHLQQACRHEGPIAFSIRLMTKMTCSAHFQKKVGSAVICACCCTSIQCQHTALYTVTTHRVCHTPAGYSSQ